MWQRGGAWVSGTDGKYSVEVNSPESIAALKWVENMFCGDPVVAMPGALSGANSQSFFVSGKTGIYLHGPFAFSDFDKSLGADKYEVVMAPAGPAGSTVLQERTSIYFGATSDMPEEQKRLAEFLISPEGQTLSMTGPGQPVVRLPVNINVDAVSVYNDQRWAVVEQQHADSQLMISDIDFTGIRVDIAETVLSIFTRCLVDIEPEINALADRMKEELAAQDALK
jgi:multiple sugar transport system substrate-binding protein